MSKSSSTNYPNGFFIQIFISFPVECQNLADGNCFNKYLVLEDTRPKIDLGGYSGEVPPLPIPNREVKLTRADGTAVFPWESR